MRSALGDAGGTIAVVTALTFGVLLTVVGGAVDFARWHDASARTQQALDAAVLAAVHQLQDHPDDAGYIAQAAIVDAALGRKEDALREIQKALEMVKDPFERSKILYRYS